MYNPIRSQLERNLTGWRKKPGFIIDQMELIHVNAQMLGVPTPKRGYARIIPHPCADAPGFKAGAKPWGVAFNPQYLKEFPAELDGVDADTDKVYCIAVNSPDGPAIIPCRLPASIGAGKTKRLSLANAKELQSLDIHFYTLQNQPDFTDSVNQPDVLKAIRLPDAIGYPGADQLEKLADIMFGGAPKGTMGAICLLMWILARSGAYVPELHKVNFSEEVIDRMHNGDGDPRRIQKALEDALLDHIEAGRSVEQCYWHRVSDSLAKRYQKRQAAQGVPDTKRKSLHRIVKLRHDPWCETIFKERNRLNADYGYRAETLARMAAGPSWQLTRPISEAVLSIAADVIGYWNYRWSTAIADGDLLRKTAYRRARQGVEPDRSIPWDELSPESHRHLSGRAGINGNTSLTPDVANALADELRELARRDASAYIRTGYRDAKANNARNGAYAAALLRAWHSRAQQVRRPKSDWSPLFRELPQRELDHFYLDAPVTPTIVMHPQQGDSIKVELRTLETDAQFSATGRIKSSVLEDPNHAAMRREARQLPDVEALWDIARNGDKISVFYDDLGRYAGARLYEDDTPDIVAEKVQTLTPGADYQVAAKGRSAALVDANGAMLVDLPADAKRFIGMRLTFVGAIPQMPEDERYIAATAPLVFETSSDSMLLTTQQAGE